MKRLTVSMLVFMIALSLSGSVFAQEEKPDATLKLSEGQFAAGIGWSWGKGVLTFKGKNHKFKVDGLSVGDVGITEAHAVGKVYNLKKLSDFNGTYGAAAVGGAVVEGKGITTMQNENGVVIHLKSTTKGANFKLATEGVKFTREE